MDCNSWSKCADVIHRLSSRVNNEQNPLAIVDNCKVIIPSCIEKSFYQCKNNVGQKSCMEVCGCCSDPNSFVNNSNTNTQIVNPNGSSRHQFTISKMFDNKRKYIDYVVTNVLRQVVNYISVDALYKLSCCLPQTIEEILGNVTDIDSDRLVRILVTEVLQSSENNVGQLTDWYTFANSIKPLLPLTKSNDGNKEKTNDNGNQMTAKQLKSSKDKRSSERILKNHIESIFATKSSSPSVDKKKSLGSITSLTDANIPSGNGAPFTRKTSKPNNMASMNAHTKETVTPMGSKYQSKIKPDQNFDKRNKTDFHESLPFYENRSNPKRSQIQYQTLSDSHHYDHKSDKSTDRSSSSDCVLTIHHKHKHKRASNHRRQHHHYTTTSFDTPSSRSLSSRTSAPSKELIQKYKQISVNGSSIPTDTNINLVNTKLSDLRTDEEILLYEQLASSDNAAEYLNQIENSSLQLCPPNADMSSHEISHIVNEEADNQQSSLSNESNDYHVRLNTNSIPLEKKTLRINYYPNMLADFD